jgi:hypothetical protein
MNHLLRTLLLGMVLFPLMLPAQYNDLMLKVRVSDADGKPLAHPMIRVVDVNFPLGESYHRLGDAQGLIENRMTSVKGRPWLYELEVKAEGHASEQLVLDGAALDMTVATSDLWTFEMEIRLQRKLEEKDMARGPTRCAYDAKSDRFKCDGNFRKVISVTRSADPDLAARMALLAAEDAKEGVMVYGYVRDHVSDLGMAEAVVRILPEDSTARDTLVRTNAFGFYVYTLGYDRVFRLTYSAEGTISKTIVIDLMNIPEEDRPGGFGMNVDMRLFAPIPGEDLSFLEQPMGRSRYVPERGLIDWDHSVSTPVIQRLDEIMQRNRKR